MDTPDTRNNRPFTPVPDPTVLTTEALQREVVAIKELLGVRFDAARDLTSERFLRVDDSLSAQKELITLVVTAQKEAVDKTEASVAGQVRALTEQFKLGTTNLAAQLSDLKDRVVRAEAVRLGVTQQREETRAVSSGVVAAVVAAFVVAAAMVAIVGFFLGQAS
jgi:hypothetical protein